MANRFKRYRAVIRPMTAILKLSPLPFRVLLWDISRPFSGLLAIGLRYSLLSSLACRTGNNVYIGTNVTIKNWSGLEVGNDVSIHDNCYIDAFGGCLIGNDVSIAHGCSIITSNHGWLDPSKPIKYNDVKKAGVALDDDVWIGCGARILPGVRIAKRCVIGAGSVVTRSTRANAVFGGVPAKMIKTLRAGGSGA
jgi:acetyltransferase-like isoleucine patch superfamily enzyme